MKGLSVNITIRNAFKKFGDNVIIPNLNLDVRSGEFFTLLGPSGCGKTTLLRMIAGFNTIDGGEFYFDDRLINDLNPAKRNIGMVFQSYAIFPHMTVRKNVEFGLTNKNMPKAEIRSKAERFMELMQIKELADRMPTQLSGGQQQRVALARALCIEPDVLLMDEPLSNLDAKLRIEMRTVIKHIQQTVGITTIYVTHDQVEAMAISDRIAVMNKGEIQHIGTPRASTNAPPTPLYHFIVPATSSRRVGDEGDVPSSGMRTTSSSAQCAQRVQEGAESDHLCAPKSCPSAESQRRIQHYPKQRIPGSEHALLRLPTYLQMESVHESTLDSIIEPGTEVFVTFNTEKINLLPMALTSWRRGE